MVGLGLCTGLAWDDFVDPPDNFSPNDLTELIGWWDFTDVSVMYSSVADESNPPYVANPSDGDLLTKVENKAVISTRLGNFIKMNGTTATSAVTPVFKTGGQNNLSYGYWSANTSGNNGSAPMHSSSASGKGGVVDGSTFSTASISTQNKTTFYVLQNEYTTVTGSGSDYFLSLVGSGGYSASPPVPADNIRIHSSDDEWRTQIDDNGSNVQIDSGQDATTGFQYWTLLQDAGTNATKFFKNGDESLGATATVSTDYSLDLDTGGISIGGYSTGSGYYAGTMSGNSGAGTKIYEVIIYNKTLVAPEIDLVHAYLNDKYNL